MGFLIDSELMENQKHATVMADDKTFGVLQTPDGHSLFFSIGTDKRLWVCREVPKTQTGWQKTDLSAKLWTKHATQNPSVTSFVLSQSQNAGKCDLMLALDLNGSEHLYMSLDVENIQETWEKGIEWTPVPFDAQHKATPIKPPSPLKIVGLFMEHMPVNKSGVAPQDIFIDIISDPENGFEAIDRYWISPTEKPHWRQHDLSIDLTAGTIQSCLGTRRADLHVPGIYTIGSLDKTPALVYTTQWNPEGHEVAPFSVIFEETPLDRTAIASAFDKSGYTNLFVSAPAGLYCFTADRQKSKSKPILIIDAKSLPVDKLFHGISEMSAMSVKEKTYIWCLNGAGELFYSSCPQGEEAIPSSWSLPVPICTHVESYAFYANVSNNNNTVFAHVSGNKVYKFSQNSITTAWTRTEILLPATNAKDIVTYKSYTTQIKYTDTEAPGVQTQEIRLTIRSVSHVTVYINDVYQVLDPNDPLTVVTRNKGCLDIVQPTSSFSTICYYVWLADGDESDKHLIDPQKNAYEKLGKVKRAEDLDIQVRNEYGVPRDLVPGGQAKGVKGEAADFTKDLCKMHDKLPKDGSVLPIKSSHENLPVATGGLGFDFGLRILAGDFFHWLDNAGHLINYYYTHVVDEAHKIYLFVAHIGSKVFHTVLNCASAVAGAIKFVYNKIKVGIEDLVAWLGFLFEWPDILRTHRALKNVIVAYLNHCVDEIGVLEGKVKTGFEQLEKDWNSIFGYSGPSSSIGASKAQVDDIPGAHSPQSSWGVNHFMNGYTDASTAYKPPKVEASISNTILGDLLAMATDEIKIAEGAADRIKSRVMEKINTLTPMQAAMELISIFGDAILSTGENFIVKFIDIIKLIVKDAVEMLTHTIEIPIVSPLYKKFASADLSILDIVCLVAAMPVTIICKAVPGGKTPFPEGSPLLADDMTFEQVAAVLYPSEGQVSKHGAPLPELLASGSWVDILQVCFNFVALPAAYIWCGLSTAKYALASANQPVPPLLGYVMIPAYIALVTPNFPALFDLQHGWVNIMNDVVTIVAIGKACCDNFPPLLTWIESQGEDADTWNYKISPGLDMALNAVWLAPAIGAIVEDHSKASKDMSFAANACFDIGGIITPIGTIYRKDPAIAAWIFLGGTAFGNWYGDLSAITAGLLLGDK